MAEKSYHVAFRYTAAAEGYEGVVTWTSFASKEAFDAWYTEEKRALQTVVEEGVTPARAVQLCSRTPIESLVAAKFQDASRPDGTIDPNHLLHGLNNVAFAVAFGGYGAEPEDASRTPFASECAMLGLAPDRTTVAEMEARGSTFFDE